MLQSMDDLFGIRDVARQMNSVVLKPASALCLRGFRLVELIVVTAILVVLTGLAVPLARVTIKREKERELRHDLWELRDAIDRYQYASQVILR